ncbi:TasA family protein [Halalkalibacillus halophilus]|uniref:TasA family protein n=1 Tax=Halalkalibacillus halophilus TaxID=392827 RepID=UPI00042A3F5F|nr:TasA family protein [Halalkalibacillus halophilus]
MSIKKKLGAGVLAGALGLSMVGGGTFAYFSDTAETTNTFATGTLDLSVDPTEIIEVDNLKPGDFMPRAFELINGGTLDISSVDLHTSYDVDYGDKYNGGDLGEHIIVHFMTNIDKNGIGNVVNLDPNNVITSTTLAELRDANGLPDAVKNDLYVNLPFFGETRGEKAGLEAGDSDDLVVFFEFVDNDEDQNTFQDASLTLQWDFEAQQTEGELR